MNSIVDKYKNLSQLKKNMVSGVFFSAVNIFITVLSYPIYLRYLGAEKYGLWVTVSVILDFSQIGQLGIDTAVMKYVAGEYGKGDLRSITKYISTAFYILMIPFLIVICFLLFFQSQISEFIGLNKTYPVEGKLLLVFVGFLSVFSYFINVLRGVVAGIGRLDIANYTLLFGRVSQIILAVYMLFLGCGVWSLYWGFVLYYIFPLMIWAFILHRFYYLRIFDPMAFSKEKLLELIKFGGTLITGDIANMFVMPFNRIIIAKYIGLSEVTFYQIAIQVIQSIRGLFQKALESILPKVSEVHGRKENAPNNVLLIHQKGMKFVMFFAFPIFLMLFLMAHPILKIWLLKRFDIQIVTVLRILIVGWFFNVLAIPDYYMFIGIGKLRYSLGEVWIRSVTNILLILVMLFLHIRLTLINIVLVNAFSLIAGMIFLKYNYFRFKMQHKAIPMTA